MDETLLKDVFSNIEEITKIHTTLYLKLCDVDPIIKKMDSADSNPNEICKAVSNIFIENVKHIFQIFVLTVLLTYFFSQKMEQFKIYGVYARNSLTSNRTLEKLNKDPNFLKFVMVLISLFKFFYIAKLISIF